MGGLFSLCFWNLRGSQKYSQVNGASLNLSPTGHLTVELSKIQNVYPLGNSDICSFPKLEQKLKFKLFSQNEKFQKIFIVKYKKN